MIIKVQYQNRKKYIKLQTADFEEFMRKARVRFPANASTPATGCSAVREKFSTLVNKIIVEDDSGTDVDNKVFADLSAMEGICFVIKDSHDKDLHADPTDPLNLTVTFHHESVQVHLSHLHPHHSPHPVGASSLCLSSSSDSETSRQPKRIRCEKEVLSSSARDLIKQILQKKTRRDVGSRRI
ncbi:hypothetical protein QTP86_014709 [Hemibagrus guttatus]|nr:hypothetical protein QTP86_014709 [Hemibagrus guttatus]